MATKDEKYGLAIIAGLGFASVVYTLSRYSDKKRDFWSDLVSTISYVAEITTPKVEEPQKTIDIDYEEVKPLELPTHENQNSWDEPPIGAPIHNECEM